MGREIKRVPLDFNWPLEKVWKGFLNPYYGLSTQCGKCGGSGSTAQVRELQDLWYGNLPFHPAINGSIPFPPDHPKIRSLAINNAGPWALEPEAIRLAEHFNSAWSHHLNQEDVDALWEADRLRHDFKNKPTAKQVNEWSLVGLGHGAINCWTAVSARAAKYGWPVECPTCKGEGSLWPFPDDKAKAESWEREQPPRGDAYQLWETVSEGSPISPPFASPEELADWLAKPQNQRGVDKGTTREQWLAFIKGPGWAPSFIDKGNGLQTGVQAVE